MAVLSALRRKLWRLSSDCLVGNYSSNATDLKTLRNSVKNGKLHFRYNEFQNTVLHRNKNIVSNSLVQ